jgi:hypothetical protein
VRNPRDPGPLDRRIGHLRRGGDGENNGKSSGKDLQIHWTPQNFHPTHDKSVI